MAGSTELQVGPCVPFFGSGSHVLDCNDRGCEGQGRRWCGQACWGCYQLDCFALNCSCESNQDPSAQLWISPSVQDLANYRNQKEICYHRKAHLQSRDLRTEQRHRHDTHLTERRGVLLHLKPEDFPHNTHVTPVTKLGRCHSWCSLSGASLAYFSTQWTPAFLTTST